MEDTKEYKEDCFAFYRPRNRAICKALIEIDCRNCKFYKNKEKIGEIYGR